MGFGLVVAVAGAVLLVPRRSEVGPAGEDLLAVGLPVDLYHYAGQLRALHLPTAIDDPERLPPDLAHLTVGELDEATAARLPRRLETLTVAGYASLDTLAGLPPDLTELDLHWARVGSIEGLPAGVRSLRLGQVDALSPKDLAGVEHLSIAGTSILDLWELPPSVHVLELSGWGVEGLEGAGPGVGELLLRGTRVQATAGLPPNVESLILEQNPLLDPIRVDSLPDSLVELRMVGQRLDSAPERESLPYLRILHLRHVRLPTTVVLDRLSPSLAELEMDAEQVEAVEGLPSYLVHLGLIGHRHHDLSVLPASLRSLRLEVDRRSGGAAGDGATEHAGGAIASLSTLGAPIESLVLRHHGGPAMNAAAPLPIEALPESVTELELHGVPLAPSIAWSPRLRSLRYWDVPSRELPALPESLEVLDLAGVGLRLPADLGRLPRLREVRLADDTLSSVPALPDSVVALDLAATDVHSLAGQQWPAQLKELTVNQYQLESLEGLPSSVRVLRIEPSLPPTD